MLTTASRNDPVVYALRMQAYSVHSGVWPAVAGLPLLLFLHALQDSAKPLAVIDCSTASGQAKTEELLLRGAVDGMASKHSSSSEQHLLDVLQKGTLVLNNVHQVCEPVGQLTGTGWEPSVIALPAAMSGSSSSGSRLTLLHPLSCANPRSPGKRTHSAHK